MVWLRSLTGVRFAIDGKKLYQKNIIILDYIKSECARVVNEMDMTWARRSQGEKSIYLTLKSEKEIDK